MPVSNLSICYQGIQRLDRNAIVRHIRAALTQEFPDTCLEKLRKPFKGEEWEKIKANAEERRRTGEISSAIKDEFDLLSVNHFLNVFESYYEVLCPTKGDKTFEKQQKQAFLQWLKTIKSLRDPLSDPSEEDYSFED
jgi:hypothetical protein